MEGEERFVRGHHRLPRGEGAEDEAFRGVVAADQLDHDVDRRVVDQPLGVAVEMNAVEGHAAIALRVQVRHPDETQRAPEPVLDLPGVRRQHFRDTRADRAETDQTDPNLFLHAHPSASRKKRRIPRTAWRMRWRFSTSAKRT